MIYIICIGIILPTFLNLGFMFYKYMKNLEPNVRDLQPLTLNKVKFDNEEDRYYWKYMKDAFVAERYIAYRFQGNELTGWIKFNIRYNDILETDFIPRPSKPENFEDLIQCDHTLFEFLYNMHLEDLERPKIVEKFPMLKN